MTFLEKTVKNSKDMNDCLDKLAPLLRTFETCFNKVYINYDNTEYICHLKIYKSIGTYVLVCLNYENNNPNNLDVIISNKEPRHPNTVFPMITFLMPKGKHYHFDE